MGLYFVAFSSSTSLEELSDLSYFNMPVKKPKTKLKSLSHGRPPTVKPLRSISSKATRTLIRSHHTLEKEKAKAQKDGDVIKAAAIARQIELQGGIEGYQKASLKGQANDRGGDSSRILSMSKFPHGIKYLNPLI